MSKRQVQNRQRKYDYDQGPMHFLSQQIVKRMEQAGWPAKIYWTYRSAEKQAELYAQGRTTKGKIVTKAKPYSSAHNYYEASDIVHSELFWNAPPEFWETLKYCTLVVEEEFGVDLTGGYEWGWDFAHIELADWKKVRRAVGRRSPTPFELQERFKAVLPRQWAQYKKSKRGDKPDLMASASQAHVEVQESVAVFNGRNVA